MAKIRKGNTMTFKVPLKGTVNEDDVSMEILGPENNQELEASLNNQTLTGKLQGKNITDVPPGKYKVLVWNKKGKDGQIVNDAEAVTLVNWTKEEQETPDTAYSYRITIQKDDNCSFTASSNKKNYKGTQFTLYRKGLLTLTVTPSEGYSVNKVTVGNEEITGTDNTFNIYIKGDTQISITTKALLTPVVTFTPTEEVLISNGMRQSYGTLDFESDGKVYCSTDGGITYSEMSSGNQVLSTAPEAGSCDIYVMATSGIQYGVLHPVKVGTGVIRPVVKTIELSSTSGTAIYPKTLDVNVIMSSVVELQVQNSNPDAVIATFDSSTSILTIEPKALDADGITSVITLLGPEDSSVQYNTAIYTVTVNRGIPILEISSSGKTMTYPQVSEYITAYTNTGSPLSITNNNPENITTALTGTVNGIAASPAIITGYWIKEGVSTITITAKEIPGYKSVSKTCEFTTRKGQIQCSISGNTSFKYSGSPNYLKLLVSSPSGCKVESGPNTSYGTIDAESSGSVAITLTGNGLTDTGETTVYYKVSKDNYEDFTGSAKLIVTTATIPIEISLYNNIYNTQPQVIASGICTEGSFYLGYSTSSTTDSSTVTWGGKNQSLYATNAGTYYIWYKTTDTSGYSTDPVYYNQITMEKATQIIELSSQSGVITYPSTVQFTISTKEITTLSITNSNPDAISFTLSNNKVTVTPKALSEDGVTAVLTISGTDSDNYIFQSVQYTVIVNRATPEIVLSESQGMITYPETSRSFSVYSNSGGTLTVSNEVPSVCSTKTSGSTNPVSSSKAVIDVTWLSAGTSYIQLYIGEVPGYKLGVTTYTLTAAKGNTEVTVSLVSDSSKLVYDDSAVSLVESASVRGINSDGTYTEELSLPLQLGYSTSKDNPLIIWNGTGNTDVTVNSTGTFHIWYKIGENEFYNSVDSTYCGQVTVTETSLVDLVVTEVPYNGTYDGSTHYAAVSTNISGCTIQSSASNSSQGETSIVYTPQEMTQYKGSLGASKWWYTTSSASAPKTKHVLIPVNPGDVVMVQNDGTGEKGGWCGFTTSKQQLGDITSQLTIYWASGWTERDWAGEQVEDPDYQITTYTAPEDAAYFIVSTYDGAGNKACITVTVKTITQIEGSTEYESTDSTSNTAGIEVNLKAVPCTDSGDYVTYYKVSKSGYDDITGSIKSSIQKATISCNVQLAESGVIQEDTYALGTFVQPTGASSYSLGYGTSSTSSSDVTWTTQTSGTISLNTSDTGTYYIWYKVSGDSNHSDVGPVYKGTVTVYSKTVPTVTITLTERTYTGNSQVVASSTCVGGTCYLGYGDSSTSTTSVTWLTADQSISRTDAGTYYIWYRVTGNSGYSNISATCYGNVKINPVATTLTLTSGGVTTYDGNTYYAKARTSIADGIIYYGTTSGSKTYKLNGSLTDVSLSSMGRSDYGTTTIYVTFIPTSSNYSSSSGSTTVAIINQASSTITLTSASATYPNQAIITAKGSIPGTIYYYGATGSTYQVAYTSASVQLTETSRINAGSRTVSAYLVPTDTNYKQSAVKQATASVTARTVTYTAPSFTTSTLVYDGSIKTLTSGGSCTEGGVMYYYVSTSNTTPAFSTSTWTTTCTATSYGTYYVWYYIYVSDTTNNKGTNINTVLQISGSKTIQQGDSDITSLNVMSWNLGGFSGGSGGSPTYTDANYSTIVSRMEGVFNESGAALVGFEELYRYMTKTTNYPFNSFISNYYSGNYQNNKFNSGAAYYGLGISSNYTLEAGESCFFANKTINDVSGGRYAYYAYMTINGETILVFVVLPWPNDNSLNNTQTYTEKQLTNLYFRQLYSLELRAKIKELGYEASNKRVIILGDFNCFPQALMGGKADGSDELGDIPDNAYSSYIEKWTHFENSYTSLGGRQYFGCGWHDAGYIGLSDPYNPIVKQGTNHNMNLFKVDNVLLKGFTVNSIGFATADLDSSTGDYLSDHQAIYGNIGFANISPTIYYINVTGETSLAYKAASYTYTIDTNDSSWTYSLSNSAYTAKKSGNTLIVTTTINNKSPYTTRPCTLTVKCANNTAKTASLTLNQAVYVGSFNIENDVVSAFVDTTQYPEGFGYANGYTGLEFDTSNSKYSAYMSKITVNGEAVADRRYPRAVTFTVNSKDYNLREYNLKAHTEYTVEDGTSVIQFTTTGDKRQIYLTGDSTNCRDMGGWKTQDGTKRMKYNILYRGASLKSTYCDAEDMDRLADLGIDYELDLRSSSEGNDDQTIPNATRKINGGCLDGPQLVYYTSNTALSSSVRSGKISNVKGTLSNLLTQIKAGKIIYFHCTGGKDRTGLIALLLESMCGCSEDVLIKDWELTAFAFEWTIYIHEKAECKEINSTKYPSTTYATYKKSHPEIEDTYWNHYNMRVLFQALEKWISENASDQTFNYTYEKINYYLIKKGIVTQATIDSFKSYLLEDVNTANGTETITLS